MMEMNERREIEIFNQLCRDHIEHAREKHPKFAEIASFYNTYVLDNLAQSHRLIVLEKAQTVHMILLSEVYEFLAELKRGNYDRAREEAADIVAVLWRALQCEHIRPIQKGE